MRKPKKPTEMQQKAIQHLLAGKNKQQAMLAAGYSYESSRSPKKNLTDRPGARTAMEEYREHLKSAGVVPEVLAEIQAAGLFDDNPAIRLDYLKENKKSLGLAENEPTNQFNQQINITVTEGIE